MKPILLDVNALGEADQEMTSTFLNTSLSVKREQSNCGVFSLRVLLHKVSKQASRAPDTCTGHRKQLDTKGAALLIEFCASSQRRAW